MQLTIMIHIAREKSMSEIHDMGGEYEKKYYKNKWINKKKKSDARVF